jgi:hypothetical protein
MTEQEKIEIVKLIDERILHYSRENNLLLGQYTEKVDDMYYFIIGNKIDPSTSLLSKIQEIKKAIEDIDRSGKEMNKSLEIKIEESSRELAQLKLGLDKKNYVISANWNAIARYVTLLTLFGLAYKFIEFLKSAINKV